MTDFTSTMRAKPEKKRSCPEMYMKADGTFSCVANDNETDCLHLQDDPEDVVECGVYG